LSTGSATCYAVPALPRRRKLAESGVVQVVVEQGRPFLSGDAFKTQSAPALLGGISAMLSWLLGYSDSQMACGQVATAEASSKR